jgi:hypothetical protein
MVDPARRAKVLRELEQEFVPDYDALHILCARTHCVSRGADRAKPIAHRRRD